MAWFKRREKRADEREKAVDDTVEVGADLLRALLGQNSISREDARQIPAVQACLGIIAGAVTGLPVRMYEKHDDGTVSEVTEDGRLVLLNDDTGDTMTAANFWTTVIEDMFLGKGAYVYLNRVGSQIKSIHHVRNSYVSIIHSEDPIFKEYVVNVGGQDYAPYEFLKILRRTDDGYTNRSLIEDNSMILGIAKNAMLYESRLVEKGGNKKGFLQANKKLSESAMDRLKAAFRNLYSNNEENVVVLNDGVTFQESSNTSVEMQMNENKRTNNGEIGRMMGVPASFLDGSPSEKDCENLIRYGIVPVLTLIESALDRDMLLESEKGRRYFAFDTKELTRANIKERYEAYQTGIKNNFLQIDEVREMEDMEPLGLDWITLGLDQVLYNPKTGDIYTPNTNKMVKNNLEGSETE